MAKKRKLLLVDDEVDIIIFLKQLLKDEGYSSVTANSGQEALQIVKNEPIDILITDIRMPEMDGIELIDKVSKIDKNIHTIMLTGHGDIDTAIQAMKTGSLNYLRKPVNFEELLITIRQGLAISVLRENLEDRTNDLIKSNNELKKTLSEVKLLKSFLPICASCKKIRDDEGYWNRIEKYIENHTDTKFSHGICPECSEKLYGDEDWFKEIKKKNN